MSKINIRSLALAIGATWGIGCLFLGWTAAFDWGDYFVEMMSSIYIGYRPGFVGGIVGGIWGFVDGAICGFLISYFYNWFTAKEQPKSKSKKK